MATEKDNNEEGSGARNDDTRVTGSTPVRSHGAIRFALLDTPKENNMLSIADAYAIDHDRHNDAESYLVDAIRNYAQKSQDLSTKCDEIRRVLAHVEEYLLEEYQLNSLGELQSRSGDFDRLCGERYHAGQDVTKLAWQLHRLGVLTEARMDHILDQTPFARDKQDA